MSVEQELYTALNYACVSMASCLLAVGFSPNRNDKDVFSTVMPQSAAHAKIDSNLVLAIKKARQPPSFDQPTKLEPGVIIPRSGQLLVDVSAHVIPDLSKRIEALGGRAVSSFPTMTTLRADLPASELEALAEYPDVLYIRPADEATTNIVTNAGTSSAATDSDSDF